MPFLAIHNVKPPKPNISSGFPATIGRVKWFNDRKGFGFIEVDLTGEQIFVHYSAIQREGYRSLLAGERVRVEYEETETTLRAVKVWPVTSTGAEAAS